MIARWLAVIPGTAAAAILLSFPIRLLALLYQLLPDSGEAILINENGQSVLKTIPLDALERLGMAAFAPAVMILAAGYIAPKFKFATSCVIGIAIAAFMIVTVSIIRRSTAIQLTSGSAPEWIMFVLWGLSVSAGIYGAWSLWKRVPGASI